MDFCDCNSESQPSDLTSWALFSSEKISDFGTVAFSFVCDKYYLVTN